MTFDEYWNKFCIKRRMAGPRGKKRPSFSLEIGYEKIDYFHMKEALLMATQAGSRGEVPVGAVLCQRGRTLVLGENAVEAQNSGLAHAEILVLEKAIEKLGRRLTDCTLYVTMEPCPMCAGAMVNARLGRLVYGTADPERGGCGSMVDVLSPKKNLWKVRVRSKVLEAPCRKLIQSFFKSRREQKGPKLRRGIPETGLD